MPRRKLYKAKRKRSNNYLAFFIRLILHKVKWERSFSRFIRLIPPLVLLLNTTEVRDAFHLFLLFIAHHHL